MSTWLRWYAGTIEDGKFRVVARNAGVTVATVIGVWAALLEDAASDEHRGVAARDFEFIEAVLGLEEHVVADILDAMRGVGLVAGDEGAIEICRWKDRQFESDIKDPTNADRQRRFREKRKGNACVTDRNGSVTVAKRPETDTDTDTEKKNTPLPPTGEEPEPAKFIRDRSSGLAVTRAYEAYCQAAIRSNTPLPIGLSPDLRRSIGARLKDSGQEAWDKAIANMEASDFLRGLNGDGGFICNIHWFAKPSNFAKVLSGCYANRQAKGKGGQVVDMQALLADVRAKYGAQNAQGV